MDDLNLKVKFLLSQMSGKDTAEAYKALQELERLSDESDILYPYTDSFVAMISSDQYGVRVRGIRLLCRQAKWDRDYKLDEDIDAALTILQDAKPTAVRQALAALHYVVKYKSELRDIVFEAASRIDYLKYKETMHSLIAKDIRDLYAEQ